MILHFSFEALSALKAGADAFLDGEGVITGSVLAPPESRYRIEELVPLLHGDVSLSSLAELRGIQVAVNAIVECLRAEMEFVVVSAHAADEGAVSAYFDFAHSFTVAHRIGEMADEMTALIELVTGGSPTPEAAHDFHFAD